MLLPHFFTRNRLLPRFINKATTIQEFKIKKKMLGQLQKHVQQKKIQLKSELESHHRVDKARMEASTYAPS
jgi:hypothetical protein